ncbi:unnamed protein product [Lasius platythorax]|uniref:Uncharacterized protein n=1 Tax=Lasius platythorax TaxID=488582 RepID=A0AAV2P2L4_9HYME
MEMLNPRKSHHNVRLIFIVTFVIFLCYTSVTDTAGLRLKKDPVEIKLLNDSTYPWSIYNRIGIRLPRATKNSDEEDAPKRYCHNTACGWGVYDSYTRNVEYYMRNTCECPDKSYKCVRVGDDLSASAYVYRCRQNSTADDIELVEDAN